MKKIQSGRSMVEMLGVLAIIGVLSVGAIAGYSKAMKKHKLNVQSQGLSMLLQNALDFASSLNIKTLKTENITEILDKLKYVPEGFRYDKKTNYVVDNFSSNIRFDSSTKYPSAYNFGLRYYVEDTNFRFDICVNLINVAKEYRGQIHYLTVTNPDKGQTNYYGDFGCKQGRICLATLTMENIYNMCKVQNNEKQGSMFSFSWF